MPVPFVTVNPIRADEASSPLVIVTTLPDQKAPDWELRYTASGQWNESFHGQREQIRENPYRFWYRYYAQEFVSRDMKGIALVNIDGTTVRRMYPD